MEEERKDLPSRFAVFSAKNGKPEVVARFEDDDVWLTQKHLSIIFNTTKQLISHHIGNIIDSGELDANRTVKKYLTVQTEGGREIGRHVEHYNLDMILALGYRMRRRCAKRRPNSRFIVRGKCGSSNPTLIKPCKGTSDWKERSESTKQSLYLRHGRYARRQLRVPREGVAQVL